METSQPPLSIESFSYSWLVNLKPSLEALEFDAASDELTNSFIEMDPRMPPSKRFFKKNSKDFKFDFPTSDSPLTVVHADEIFSNGYLMPFFVDSMKKDMPKDTDNSADSNLPSSSSSSFFRKKSSLPSGLFRSRSLRRCGRISKRLLEKYLDFFIQVYRRLKGHKSSSSMAETFDKLDRRVQSLQTLRSWMNSSEKSPRISVAYSAEDWRRSCDSESSINEAVLHCKRSIEK